MAYYSNNSDFSGPKVIILAGKIQIDQLIQTLPSYATGNWQHLYNLEFLYNGVPNARLTIPYSKDSWRKGYIEFGGVSNVVAINKDYLSENEIDKILESFIADVLRPYKNEHADIKIQKLISGKIENI